MADMVNTDWVDNSSRQEKINSTYNDISQSAQGNLTKSNAEGNAIYDSNEKNLQDYYAEQAKSVEEEYQKSQRMNDDVAAANGLNTGNGSQLGLAGRASAFKANSILNKSQTEQSAQNTLARQKMNIQYTNAMAEAVANNNYVKAAALLDEYSNEYDNAITQAQASAAYGDFSGYETLYGKDAADNMKTVWEYQNPLIAYNLGQITADKYYQLTGSYPPGYVDPNASSGYGYAGDDSEWYYNNVSAKYGTATLNNTTLENAAITAAYTSRFNPDPNVENKGYDALRLENENTNAAIKADWYNGLSDQVKSNLNNGAYD